MAPHTNCWTNDEPDGTSFHEIITLPTLAPHLARAEHLVPYMTQSMVPPLHALTPDVPNATPPQVSSTGTELSQAGASKTVQAISHE